MKIEATLGSVSSLFLETAPIIYFVEANPLYFAVVEAVFQRIDQGSISAVTSPVTLAECLIFPVRANDAALQKNFSDLIVSGNNTTFVSLNAEDARQAASLRARYNLTLTDAFQISAALASGCDAFLTNDNALKRVTELRILVIDELEL